jgi:hypothetical protein
MSDLEDKLKAIEDLDEWLSVAHDAHENTFSDPLGLIRRHMDLIPPGFRGSPTVLEMAWFVVEIERLRERLAATRRAHSRLVQLLGAIPTEE